MDFELAHEHTLLRDNLRRALDPARRGSDDDAWRRCVELGVATLDCRDGIATADDLVAMMVTQEELGRALAHVPFVDAVVQAAALLRTGGTHRDVIDAIERGTAIVAVAHHARRDRYLRDPARVRARRQGATWQLDGGRSLVSWGTRAQAVIVPAWTSDASCTLFLVPVDTPGVKRVLVARLDGRDAADFGFQAATLADEARIGTVGSGAALLDGARRMATVAVVAEAVGCMDALLTLTVEYLRTRRQFGRPLASFQALQHRAADMYVAVEQARSLMLFATLAARDPAADARASAVAAAKVQAGRSARFVGQQAIQLHGGIGLADECRAGHCFRRLTALELEFGDADDHLAFLGERGGLFTPGAP